MTTATEPRTRSRTPVAVAAGATGLLCTLIGTYVDTPWRNYGPQNWDINPRYTDFNEFALLIGFAVVGAAVVFGVVVRSGVRAVPEHTAVRSLIVAIVGAGSLLVFWTGLPSILAAGAAVMAYDARVRLGRTPPNAAVAMVMAALTVVAAILNAVTG